MREYAQIILISNKQLLLHAQDLKDQELLSNGKFYPHYTHGSIHSAMLEILKIVSLRVTKQEIRIKCDISGLKQFPALSFDKRRLQQVLFNVMGNAIKFTRKGLITCSSKLKTMQNNDGLLLIEVSVLDEGIGMTTHEQLHVFDAFFETNNADSRALNPNGAGIGLHFCKQICQSLEGDCVVKFSQIGVGSEFVFTMKVAVATSEQTASVSQSQSQTRTKISEKDPAVQVESVNLEFSADDDLNSEDL